MNNRNNIPYYACSQYLRGYCNGRNRNIIPSCSNHGFHHIVFTNNTSNSNNNDVLPSLLTIDSDDEDDEDAPPPLVTVGISTKTKSMTIVTSMIKCIYLEHP